MSRTNFNRKGSVLLFLTATVWGIAFVAQNVGMDYVGPFTFNGVRSLLGAASLLPVIAFSNRRQTKKEPEKDRRTLLVGGVVCGICLCIASSLQQIGIQYTTSGKAGFLTAMYIIIVPILGLFIGKKCSRFAVMSLLPATAGLYLLSVKDGFTLGAGDIYVILCAVVFSFHILAVDYFSPRCDGVKLSCIQFFVCGVLCMAVAFWTEAPQLAQILTAWLPILYAGVMSCGVGYTLQIIGQKDMNPTVASLILSLESVISVLAGWVILHEALSLRELFGCGLMFAAIILAQLPSENKN